MKRIVPLLGLALALTAAVAPAHSFNITASFSRALSIVAGMSGAHPIPVVEHAISTFDRGVVEAFGKAWSRSGNGTSGREGVVLVLRKAGGGYDGRDMGATNEQKQFTFRWHPSTIAIVHTHPNASDPKPHDLDLAVADKYRVPIFTITSRGMYAYDPHTKKISKVLDNLDWLDASKFSVVRRIIISQDDY
ncbi:MAG: hypothetical protein AABN34_14585 [Acidobacteriota bacterium]